MTPFGEAVRRLRTVKGVTQKQMAEAIGVSPAYLSALEHGRRSAPSFDFIQRVAGYFNIIWDDVEELLSAGAMSHPRIVIDTSGLGPDYTAFANRLSRHIRKLDQASLKEMSDILAKAEQNR